MSNINIHNICSLCIIHMILFSCVAVGQVSPGNVLSNANDNLEVCYSIVKDPKLGYVLGVRIEAVNIGVESNIVMSVYRDEGKVASLYVYDSEGFDISPMKEMQDSNQENSAILQTIFPQEGRVWYIPFPRMVRSNPRLMTNNENLMPISSGIYSIKICVDITYCETKKTDIMETYMIKHVEYIIDDISIDKEFLTKNIPREYARSSVN